MDNWNGATPRDFFSNAAAREAGLTEHFWHQAYLLYLEEADRDPGRSLEKYDIPRTVRVPWGQGHVDVMARVQPEPREYRIVRFTAFPAGGEPGAEVHQVSRWHHREEARPVLGGGALLDENARW